MWIKERGLRYSRVRGKRLVKREWADEFLEAHESDHGNKVDRIVSETLKDMNL
jgi:hypothetical protein